MPSLHGRGRTGLSRVSKPDDTSNSSTGNREPETSSSLVSFDSNRDERGDGTDSGLSSESEREILQVVESNLPKPRTTVPKRTPLPNSRAKRPHSPLAPTKPASRRPIRQVKRGTKWSDQEDALIKRLKNRDLSWQDVSNQLPGRSANACSRRYHRSLSSPTATAWRGKWSEEEVKKLNALKNEGLEWEEIAKQLPGRTSAACRRKMETLRRNNPALTKPVSKPGSAIEDEQTEGSGDEKMFEDDIEEEKPKRYIEEETYSSSSGEDVEESKIEDREPESKIKEESPGSVIEDEKVESSTSEDDPSESESEDDMAEKRRMHAAFFLNR